MRFRFLLLAYFMVAILYANNTPAWQAPDEPAHYNYIRQLAEGNLPVIEGGDYDQNYQSEVISAKFDPRYTIEPFSYEDWQPPLYYLLQTPIFWLFDGALGPLRVVSIVIGGGVVVMAYLIGQLVWPGRDDLALTAAALVAFLPQHLAMMSAVNNDGLAELLIGLILWQLLRRPRSGREWLWLGVSLGLGFLAKATVYIMAPVIGLALLGSGWWANGLRVGLPAGTLGLFWWGRNWLVYGGWDILGKMAHDSVVTGQPQTGPWIAANGLAATLNRFFLFTFQSFWGQFGWMAVVMPSWIYQMLFLFCLLAAGGLLWNWFRPGLPPIAPRSKALLLATFLLTVLVYVGYNLTFVQHQGRYLFPALIPISLAATVGLARWLPWTWLAEWLPAGLSLALIGLDLLTLFRFIQPNL